MRAAEQQGIDLRVGDGRQQALGEHSHLLGVGLASLDELDEARTRSTREFDMRGDLAAAR